MLMGNINDPIRCSSLCKQKSVPYSNFGHEKPLNVKYDLGKSIGGHTVDVKRKVFILASFMPKG